MEDNTIIVKASAFRANQGRYFSMANSGKHVILKSHMGYFRLVPVTSTDAVSADTQKVAKDLRGALSELKDVLSGKRQANPIDKLMNELS